MTKNNTCRVGGFLVGSRPSIFTFCMFAMAYLAGVPLDAAEVTIHVATTGGERATGDVSSPFADLHRALDQVAKVAAEQPSADIRLALRAGVYRIEHPLVLGRKHSPANGSLTIAAGKDGQVVISGGRVVRDWTVNPDGTWSKAMPDAVANKRPFRELFVAGQRRPRARHPNSGYLRIEKSYEDKRTGFSFGGGDLPTSWTGGGELVFLHDWSTSRIPVKEVSHDSRRLTTAFPIGFRADHYRIDYYEPHPRYYVESHRAFLDAPGEWFLDETGVLTYLPCTGEKPEQFEAVVPVADSLLLVSGDTEKPIRRVSVSGISFQHCAWQIPARGYAGVQASAFEDRGEGTPSRGRNFIPAAIQFEIAEECAVTRCEISHVGGSGIAFGSRAHRCRLENCVLEDVAANAVSIGEDTSRSVAGRPWWQSAPDQSSTGNAIAHNRIERGGQEFLGAVAVWVGLARDTQIAHNLIANHPYTGVSLGWMWNPTPTPAGGNVVSNNYIHHVMQELSDGGGIYTLGRQPGTRLIGNVIHDVPLNAGRAESNGMFLDEGSDQMEISGNTIFNLARSPLRFHKAEKMNVHDNTLVTPDDDIPPVRYNNTKPETITQTNNKIVRQSEFDAETVTVPPVGPETKK